MRSAPRRSGSRSPGRRRLFPRSSRTPLATLAVVAIALEVGIAGGLGSSYSVFSSRATNGANSFEAAATFAASGSLFAWGANANGQLGLDDTSIHYSPVQVDAASWQAVAGGQLHACGVRAGGAAYCWGYELNGRLGDGNTSSTNVSTPTAVLGGGTYTTVSAGFDHTCGIRTDQTLWCWGGNGNGQLGTGDTTSQSSPVQIDASPSTTWSAVSLGHAFTCGVRVDGTLWCWGVNSNGQLGTGDTLQQTAPTQVGVASDWASVTTGGDSTCATRTDGTLWCWGDNTSGELGIGSTASPQKTPVQVGSDTDWSAVSGGNLHMCGLKTTGTLWCWGANSNGQFGVGNTNTPQTSPQQVTPATNWNHVAVGYTHTCATRTDKTAWCWGADNNGQIGRGNTTQYTSPAQVPFASVQTIMAGSMSSMTFAISAESDIETNLAVGATATASSVVGTGFEATTANDKDASTYWESAHTLPGTAVWLQMDLGASTSVGRIVLTLPELSTWLTRTETMSVEASSDGLTYTTIVSSSDYTFDPASGNRVTITFAATSEQYWRLNITNTDNASAAGQISEFELYAS